MAVSAYFTSKQIFHIGFVELYNITNIVHNWLPITTVLLVCLLLTQISSFKFRVDICKFVNEATCFPVMIMMIKLINMIKCKPV